MEKRHRTPFCQPLLKILVSLIGKLLGPRKKNRGQNHAEGVGAQFSRKVDGLVAPQEGGSACQVGEEVMRRYDGQSEGHSQSSRKGMADLTKKPKKGILKNSSSFDAASHDRNRRPSRSDKETKWDEMNIIATLHPADKDYGHMKIEEPKTPYNYIDPDKIDVVDAKALAERIMEKSKDLPKVLQEENESEDSDEDLTPEAKEKKKHFENKRKQHYNEYYAVKLARKLLEDDDDDEDKDEDPSKRANKASSSRSRSHSPN